MRFSVKNYFYFSPEAQLVWPAEFSSSAGETSWTSKLNFSSAGFNQETPWLKPIEPVSRTGWTGLAQSDHFQTALAPFADCISFFQTLFQTVVAPFQTSDHLFQLLLFIESIALIYVASVTFSLSRQSLFHAFSDCVRYCALFGRVSFHFLQMHQIFFFIPLTESAQPDHTALKLMRTSPATWVRLHQQHLHIKRHFLH
jgi:hypothetical protein